MYEYFSGIIAQVNPAFIVVDCGGVGYKLYCPTPYAYQEGQKAKVFAQQVVRDNGMDLYGFQDENAKKLFLKLVSVSGIGPKSALAIMAAEDNDSLASAIEQGEVKYLTKFPGIGKKTASQIILDLKGKMGEFTARLTDKETASSNLPAALQDALAALKALGYTQKDLHKIAPRLEQLQLDSASAYTKKGLQLLLRQ